MGLFKSIKKLAGAALPAVGSYFGGPLGGIAGNALGGMISGQGGGNTGASYGNQAMTNAAQMYSGGSRMNQSSNQASGSTTLGTGVWGAQSPYLQDLYARAQGMSQSQPMANYGQAQSALDASQAGLMQMAGDQSMDPRLAQYGRAIGQQFNEQIMPGMRGAAQGAGGLGSSRAGIGQGLAAARAGQQVQDFGAQLYGENMNRQLQALQGLGQVSGQQQQLQGAMQAAPWQAMNQYRGLLGAPVQNNLGGSGWSTGSSSGGSSMDYGMAGNGGAGGWGAAMGQAVGGGGGGGGLGGLFDQIGGLFGGKKTGMDFFGSVPNNYYDVGNYS